MVEPKNIFGNPEKFPLGTKRIYIYSGPDDKSRYKFWLFWVSNYFPGHPTNENKIDWKGQIFDMEVPRMFKKEKEQFNGLDADDKRYRKYLNGAY